MKFGIIGSGSWATALAKILTDNEHPIHWWVRNAETLQHIKVRKHNPRYLSGAYFNNKLLTMYTSAAEVIASADVIIIAVPSAFVVETLAHLPKNIFENKKVVSAVKGILPTTNQLLNDYLLQNFKVQLCNYFTLLGPCHAEEVASEKLSYLTFSGVSKEETTEISNAFKGDYINAVVNNDVIGAQYAAVLKNIYALGAGIAHGLAYGDNFQSVYIANAANEMVSFLKKATNGDNINYAASVYLGDLLVTCYSLYSRNRMFGNMLGKGYSVKAAQLELNMVAEGYNAAKCIHLTNKSVLAEIPIATAIYEILWKQLPADEGFGKIETYLL